MTVRRPLAVASVVVSCLLLLGACGSSSPSAARRGPDSTTSTTVFTPIPEITTPTVTIGGHTYAVPTESTPWRPLSDTSDSGQQIALSPKGFLPPHLFANKDVPTVWTNLTSKPVRIIITHLGIPPSKLIPPGGSFSYTFTSTISFEYFSSTGYHGVVDVNAFP